MMSPSHKRIQRTFSKQMAQSLTDKLLDEEKQREAAIQEDEDARRRMVAFPRKPLTWFGHLPVWSECVPLLEAGQIDWADTFANIGAGLIIGMREALGGIVSSSLIFTGSNVLAPMFPFGIGMMWYSTAMGTLWYCLFGRLQYSYTIAQDIIGILQAAMAEKVASQLEDEPHRIPPTVLAVIATSAVLSGSCSFILGKLGLGKYMLLFPSPVTSGFLGAIGWVIFRSSLQTSSGVKFRYFYPVDFEAFCQPSSLAQIALQVATVALIRLGPGILLRWSRGSSLVGKLGGLFCQLLPLAVFYVSVGFAGISMETLSNAGWTYPKQSDSGGLWTTYRLSDAHVYVVLSTLPDMIPLVMMAVLCTMAGVLAITDAFPRGPAGDPAPMDTVDFDRELTTVGVSSVLLGLTGGTLTFHTFTAIQLRLDGGTHRVALLSVAVAVGGAFMSGAPIGHVIPKWYLSGLFMNTAIHFLKGSLLSYQSLPKVTVWGKTLPSPQYAISVLCIVVSIFYSPNTSISTGLFLSILLFLVKSSSTSPISNVLVGDRVVSRTMRPYWEMRTLRAEGDRILLLYLQGQLFFGSARGLADSLAAAAANERVRYCILSFARVPQVDPSAAKALKTAAERCKQRACKIICTRMNQEVFSALSVAGLIASPDDDLLMHLQGLRWRTSSPSSYKPELESSTLSTLSHRLQRLQQVKRPEDRFTSPGSQCGSPRVHRSPDAFAHETDALDYCDEYIVEKYCYGRLRSTAEPPLQPYMLAYREAARPPGARLDEWAFEDMNGLPRGFMGRLREYCEVRADVAHWTKLGDMKGSLCFIFRGAVSLVKISMQADHNLIEPEVTGFSFRQGKHLHKRYQPGSVVGKHEFFLTMRGLVVDPELDPQMVVSSKLGEWAEIWILRLETWDRLPAEIKLALTEMLCVQLSDTSRHSRLQER